MFKCSSCNFDIHPTEFISDFLTISRKSRYNQKKSEKRNFLIVNPKNFLKFFN